MLGRAYLSTRSSISTVLVICTIYFSFFLFFSPTEYLSEYLSLHICVQFVRRAHSLTHSLTHARTHSLTHTHTHTRARTHALTTKRGWLAVCKGCWGWSDGHRGAAPLGKGFACSFTRLLTALLVSCQFFPCTRALLLSLSVKKHRWSAATFAQVK